jgi:hypothetical protein
VPLVGETYAVPAAINAGADEIQQPMIAPS